jgi:hypothetical protein
VKNDAGECCPECKVGVEEGRAELVSSAPLKKAVNHEIEFRHSGRRGDVVNVASVSEHIFRGEKLIATDTLKGLGTRVRGISIDSEDRKTGVRKAREQRAVNAESPTTDFNNNSLGCGLRFNTAHAGGSIRVTVRFLEDCEFYALMVGKAVKE